jgi:hypothetical protein
MGMPEKLGAMHRTPTVKLSLLALRGYLILIVMLVFLSVLHQAGLLHTSTCLLDGNRRLFQEMSRRFLVSCWSVADHAFVQLS